MNQTINIKRGLYTQNNLESLIHYKDLCVLVALDIFTDNPDQHNKNLLLDKKSNAFYAIDMDHSLNHTYGLRCTPTKYDFFTMAIRAYNFLVTLKNKKLSREEINVLKIIYYTLEQLVQYNKPEQLHAEWMVLSDRVNFIYNPRKQEKTKKYLAYNAIEVARLLDLLNTIFP